MSIKRFETLDQIFGNFPQYPFHHMGLFCIVSSSNPPIFHEIKWHCIVVKLFAKAILCRRFNQIILHSYEMFLRKLKLNILRLFKFYNNVWQSSTVDMTIV